MSNLHKPILAIIALAAILAGMPAAAQQTYIWKGNTANWATSSEWTPSGIPGASDKAIINSGTVIVSDSRTVSELTLALGIITGNGTLTIADSATWTDGHMSGSGTTVVSSGATMRINNSAPIDLDERTLENEGTILWSGVNTLKLKHQANINNRSGALFDIRNDQVLDYVLADSGGNFLNQGTLTKSAGSGTSEFDPYLRSTGSINATSGTLRLERGDTLNSSSGTFTISSGAILALSERSFILDNLTITGSGTVDILDATVTLSGSGVTVDAGATLTMNDDLSQLAGSGPLAVDGHFDWQRGNITATGDLVFNNTLAIGSSNTKILDGATLTNEGSATLSGTMRMQNGANLLNNPAGTLDINGDLVLDDLASGGGIVTQKGSLSKSAGAGTSVIDVPLIHSGSMALGSGTLQITRGSVFTNSSISFSSSATFELKGGRHQLDTVAVSGSGSFKLSQDTLEIADGGATLGSSTGFSLISGVLTGSGTLSVDGPVIWQFGFITGSGDFSFNGDVSISGSAIKEVNGQTLTLNGTTTWSDVGKIGLRNNAVLRNGSSGIFEIENSTTMEYFVPNGGTFENLGTVTKQSSSAATTLDVDFHSSGNLNLNSGNLALTRGSYDSSATYSIAGGSLLSFESNTFHLEDVGFSGSGGVQIKDATMDITDGGATFGTGLSLAMFGSASIIQGNGPVTVNTFFDWQRGTITGSAAFTLNDSTDLSSSDAKTIDGRTVTNNGSMTFSGSGSLRLTNGAVLENSAAARIIQLADANLAYVAPGGTFSNAGLLQKNSSGTIEIETQLTNTGSINVAAGILEIVGNSTHSATTLKVAGGSTLNFTTGTHSFDGVTIDSSGSVGFSSGIFNATGSGLSIDSAITVTLSGGTLTGTGPVHIGGVFQWSSGTISGSDTLTVDSVLTISSNSAKELSGRVLVNRGSASWSGNGVLGFRNNAVLLNQTGASLDIQNANEMDYFTPNGGRFINRGTLTRSSASGSTSSFDINFYNYGTIDSQDGSLYFKRVLRNKSGGVIRGIDTLRVSISNMTNNGTVSPGASSGILTFRAGYSQTDSSRLNIEIGGLTPGSGHDRLITTNTATLKDTLNITLSNNFQPALGDVFDIVQYASSSGTFSTVNMPMAGGNPMFSLAYLSKSIRLTTINTVTINANVKVWLEGPFTGSEMDTSLNARDLLPLAQPYNTAPWNYTGSEAVTAIPGDDIVDWVLLSLRSGSDGATAVDTQAAFLKMDGSIVDTSGSGPVIFERVAPGNYYLVVHHRNHLAVMSAAAQSLSDASPLYDFTSAASQAYGDALKELAGGIYGMPGGDGNSDGDVNDSDKNLVWRAENGTDWAYDKYSDFNLDGGIDALDLNRAWRPNSGSSSQVPDAQGKVQGAKGEGQETRSVERGAKREEGGGQKAKVKKGLRQGESSDNIYY